MNECQKRGHLNLQHVCKDCGQVVCEKSLKEGGWISVKDRLPENVLILAFRDGEYVLTDGEVLEWNIGYTHWMPLPEPPK
jgi:hypothetical protein